MAKVQFGDKLFMYAIPDYAKWDMNTIKQHSID
jgi:hypothetical protein